MNIQITERTESKLKQNMEAPQHFWPFELDDISRSYRILPNVFSPNIFLGTAWLTENVLKFIPPNSKVLEIGTGCGVTAIEIQLRISDSIVSACDINEAAILNAKINADTFGSSIDIRLSDTFEKYGEDKFNVIYWNFPFHPSTIKYEELTILEKAVRDPGYNILKKFLQEASLHLAHKGIVLLGFSNTMGDIQLLYKLAQESKWKLKEVARMDKKKGTICLILLQR